MIKVIGDIMLDRWIHANANRLSPESPVPVLLESYQSSNLGGAANVALNLSRLGKNVELISCIGGSEDDHNFKKITEILNEKNVNFLNIDSWHQKELVAGKVNSYQTAVTNNSLWHHPHLRLRPCDLESLLPDKFLVVDKIGRAHV